MGDDLMAKAAGDEMQRLYRQLSQEYEQAKRRTKQHEEETTKAQEEKSRAETSLKEWDLKLKQTDKSVRKSRMELEKLNKERVAIAGKLNKLELEHSRMREQFISDFSQKMEGLELEMDSFVNQKEENDPRRLEKEKRELEVSIEKQKVDAQVCSDLIRSMGGDEAENQEHEESRGNLSVEEIEKKSDREGNSSSEM